MLNELIDIFLGAFNNYFTPDDKNYLWFSQLIVCSVCILAFASSCFLLCIIVHDILKYLGSIGGKRH